MINNLWNGINNTFTIFGIIAFVTGIATWVNAIRHPMYKLGKALSNKKIAIIAKDSNNSSLYELVKHSGIFNTNNIEKVMVPADFCRLERYDIFLLYWPDYENEYKDIISKIGLSKALVVYSPISYGRIDDNILIELNNLPYMILTNFRGRLLNDIFTSMITSGYGK